MKKFDTRTYLYIAAAGMVLILVLVAIYMLTPVSKADTTQYVYIDDDDTRDSVITKVGAIANTAGMTGLATLIRHSNYSDHIRTGRYAIEPKEGAFVVFRHLKNGRQVSMMLTIPEVRTMDRLAGFLGRKLMLDSATIATALYDQETCQQLGYDTCTIAAMFVPNSYDIYWNISLDKFLQRMQREHDRFWKGDREQKAAQMQLTPNEVCTLASIIDEETANNTEKPMIAGMYLNRLHEPMPLQADPTIKFALKDFAIKRIYHNMLQFDSPYNTYKYLGYPVGPICSPSEASIQAALEPADGDWLYFIGYEDGSNEHLFTSDYSEFEAVQNGTYVKPEDDSSQLESEPADGDGTTNDTDGNGN